METAAVHERERAGKTWLLAAGLGWVIFLLPFLLALWRGGAGAVQSFPDDTMRLVELRDLIAGRGWFDHIQPRLGLGEGTFMHWSRLVDAPIAGLVLAFRPLAGTAAAETLAQIVWPLALALAPIAAIAFAAQRLAGPRAAVLGGILAAQMLILTSEFDPGTLDHHNVQLTLLVTAVCLVATGLARPRLAAGAGLAAAASVAVGIEALPHLALLGAFVAVWWVIRGAAARSAALHFFLAFGGALALLFALSAPPQGWAGGYCDSFSRDQVAPLLLASLGMAGAAGLLSDRGRGRRAAALAGVAALALAEAFWLTPACLGNPVDQIDPWLRAVWFDRVAEARPLVEAIGTQPTNVVPMIAVWLIAAACTVVLWRRGENRGAWALVALMLAASMAMALWQMRGVLFIGALAVLPIVGVVELLYARAEATGRPRLRLAALALFFLSVPHFWAFAAVAVQLARHGMPEPSPFTTHLARCFAPTEYAALAALPPGVVAVGSNLGAFVLATTPHRVLSAPYHRNQAGMIAQFRLDEAGDDEAERMLRALGVDYVVTCSENIEFTTGDGSLPGFSYRLNAGQVPGFLVAEPAAEGGVVRVYRVAPAAGG